MKIKSCPFCNKKPILVQQWLSKTWFIECVNKKCFGIRQLTSYITTEEAITTWNIRKS